MEESEVENDDVVETAGEVDGDGDNNRSTHP